MADPQEKTIPGGVAGEVYEAVKAAYDANGNFKSPARPFEGVPPPTLR